MSMGESTRKRLEAVVHGANAGGAGNAGGGPYKAISVGGYGGGMGGTWGKAPTGRGPAGARDRPLSAGGNNLQPERCPLPSAQDFMDSVQQAAAPGKRDRIRPASAGVKSLWNELPEKALPKAPPMGLTSTRARPKSAAATRKPQQPPPGAGLAAVQYTLSATGLTAVPDRDGTGAGGGGGGGAGAMFGAQGSNPGAKSYNAGPMKMMQQLNRTSSRPSGQLEPRTAGSTAIGHGEPELTDAYLAEIEDAFRDALRNKRTVYEGAKEMLLRLFQAVDDGSGDVSPEEFCRVASEVDINITPAAAQALFRMYGHQDVLPYQKFAHVLLTQPSRQLAQDMPVRKGAFVAGQSANFNGKIIYPECRKPVYTPTTWDPAVAERSAELPNARLVLEYVYGYAGKDTPSQNLYYNVLGDVCYFSAGVGIVYHKRPAHRQHYFLGHTDDIKSLTLCTAPIKVQGKEYPGRSIVATGQVTSHEAGPCVCIWDSRVEGAIEGVRPELARIQFDKEARGIIALAFSPDGTKLVVVAMDNSHVVYVYDWRRGRELASGKGAMGEPPQVYGVEWNPHELTHGCRSAFVTFGRKHIKLWTSQDDRWVGTQISMGRLPLQNITSAAWLPPRSGQSESMIAAGVADGQIYLVKGTAAIKAVSGHRPGPQVIQPDGHPAYHGVRGMCLSNNNKTLLTGGADGVVLQWDVSDGSLQEGAMAAPSIQLQGMLGASGDKIPGIRSLDYNSQIGTILVGTSNCDIFEVTSTTQDLLLFGQAGDLWNVAFHPNNPDICATTADSRAVFLWDTAKRDLLITSHIGFQGRAVAFSAGLVDGSHHLAVGGAKGHIKILQDRTLQPVIDLKESTQGIADLKYSPNNRVLAAATYDAWIDLFAVDRGYQRTGRCTGHSATVRHLDFSADSSVLQSDCAAYEILYWNTKNGKQITASQRDTGWATYTCTLGFPVMGIWEEGTDGTDVNALHRSRSGAYCVTSDDSGYVRLFNYPCVVQDAPHRKYIGHSSHVMSVRFNADDSRVCSVGGKDWAMFQFKVVELSALPPPPPPPEKVWGPLDSSGRQYGYKLVQPGSTSVDLPSPTPASPAPQPHPTSARPHTPSSPPPPTPPAHQPPTAARTPTPTPPSPPTASQHPAPTHSPPRPSLAPHPQPQATTSDAAPQQQHQQRPQQPVGSSLPTTPPPPTTPAATTSTNTPSAGSPVPGGITPPASKHSPRQQWSSEPTQKQPEAQAKAQQQGVRRVDSLGVDLDDDDGEVGEEVVGLDDEEDSPGVVSDEGLEEEDEGLEGPEASLQFQDPADIPRRQPTYGTNSVTDSVGEFGFGT